MMSATTAFTETPATLPSAASAGAAGTTAGVPTGANEFQNLLAGAVAGGATPSLAETLPTAGPGQTIAQLFAQKNAAARPQVPLQLVTPGNESSPAEMLDLLTQSAELLPDAEADVDSTLPDELPETRAAAQPEDDILGEWLNVMIPNSVLAPQAGAHHASADGAGGEGADHPSGDLTAIPSLRPQAGLADAALAVPQARAPGATVVASEQTATQASAAATAAVTTLAASAAKADARESTPSGDEWMNAFGDVSARRTHEVAQTASAPRLATSVHDARWADALAHRLVMMAREGESVAQLRLVPQELGPLDIQISVRDGEANVHFGAAHAETRAALETSMPRLRELLSAQGLQLANASVSHQSAGSKTPERAPTVNGVNSITEESEAATAKVVSTSLLDIYA